MIAFRCRSITSRPSGMTDYEFELMLNDSLNNTSEGSITLTNCKPGIFELGFLYYLGVDGVRYSTDEAIHGTLPDSSG